MSKAWAFVFPGQGAQYPGMGKDFYDQFAIARETFLEADACLNQPLSKLIFEGPSDELTLTKNSQVAIFVTSMAIFRTVQELFPDLKPIYTAGLSLGEYTALTAAGKVSFKECLDLVRLRASAMHQACGERAGGMQVVLGLTEEAVRAALPSELQVWVANLNCPGQVVISGAMSDIPAAAEALKAKGAKRVLPLEVSGAFHSDLMRSAQELLGPKIAATQFHETSIDVVMNVPGIAVRSLGEMRRNLFEQVTSPVLWEKGVRSMQNADVFLEMGPGKTLAGMNKRIGISQPTLSIERVGDLEELAKFLEAYAIAKD